MFICICRYGDERFIFVSFLSLKTAVHNGTTKEAWCDQELIASLMMSIKRGSYDIYKALVDTGAIDPPDKLMYEEQYLTSVDIVRDLLRVRIVRMRNCSPLS